MDSTIRYGLLIFLLINGRVDAGSVQFCDGPDFVEKTREQCNAGISFGENKPECICVSGIYRFIADSCETADGFADSVCTKLTDDNGLGTSIVGVKFTRDPVNWAQTGVVCERKGFGSETWDFITEKHSRGSTTKSTNIYAINGKAYISAGHRDKKAFCVEPAQVEENERICRYLKSENEAIWKDNELEVIVKPKCDGKELQSHKCFGILTSMDSECELNCNAEKLKRGAPMGRGMGGASGKKPSSPPGRGKTTTTSTTAAPDLSHPAEYWKYDNKYLNRKMMIYNIINQLKTDNDSSANNETNATSWGEPKRTFELFDLMKNILTSYCPHEYVAKDWIDLVIELFYILHKGNIYKYDETLSKGEYEWIKDILEKCHDRLTENEEEKIVLSSMSTVDEPNPADEVCQAHGGLATGYCNGTDTEGECNFKPIPVEDHRANDSYHYVPDVAWDIVDIVQVVCFPEFNASYRMFHVLEQAAERLFTLQIKNLWYFPTWSEKTKKRLLGTSADAMVHNLEVCINSAYDLNGQIPRLVRPAPAKYLRKKRSLSSKPPVNQGQYVDIFCSKSRKDFVMPPNCVQQ